MAGARFSRSLAWNYASYLILGVSGIVINAVIGVAYGTEGLGVFSQSLAFYVLAAQLAVAGVHLSTLKHTAEFVEEPERLGPILRAALLLSACMGVMVFGASVLFREVVADVLDSPPVATGVLVVAPGLVFFALNKVLLRALNGLNRMRAFAIAQATRYLLILTLVVVAAVAQVDVRYLPGCFTIAEAVMTVALLIALAPVWLAGGAETFAWVRVHFVFGVKGFVGGMLLELNARVDVLMLGLFVSDAVVGVYALAAMVAEGFYGLLAVVATVVNPSLVPLLKEDNPSKVRRLVGRVQRWVYPTTVAAAAAVLGGYYVGLLILFGPEGEFAASAPVLGILLSGIVLASGYLPFNGVLLQAGRPGHDTVRVLLTVASNIALNVALIPSLGILGAALATALALLLSVMYLNLIVRRQLGFFLGFFPRSEPEPHEAPS